MLASTWGPHLYWLSLIVTESSLHTIRYCGFIFRHDFPHNMIRYIIFKNIERKLCEMAVWSLSLLYVQDLSYVWLNMCFLKYVSHS